MSELIINKTLRVETGFRFEEREMPVISYRFYYPVAATVPLYSGELKASGWQDVDCKAPDGFMLKGTVSSEAKTEEMVMLGNLYYGFNPNSGLQNHFEGTIAIYPFKEPQPRPVPVEPGKGTDDPPGEFSIDSPLFPYIDIEPWPKEPIPGNSLNFFRYNPSLSPEDSLYYQLVKKAREKDRAGMEALAIRFLQREAPFGDQYFESLVNVPAPFNKFPAVYDLLRAQEDPGKFHELLQDKFGTDYMEKLVLPVQQNNVEQGVDLVWQNYFALTIITGFNEPLFIEINKILLIVNLLLQWNSLEPEPGREKILYRLLNATCILPETVFPLPPYAQTTNAKLPSGIVPYAIGRLKMARYRLLQYAPGEIARVENVMMGEKKKVTHRSVTRTTEQTVDKTTRIHGQQNLSQETTDELLVETKKTVAALVKEIKYNDLTTTYGPPTQAILNGSYSDSIKPGDPMTKGTNSFAGNVLNKTLERINDAVSRSRAFGRFTETENIAESIFDNQEGRGHFRGIYRWLNKVYRVSIMNYGNRFLLEVHINHPAKKWMDSEQSLNNINLQQPLSPAQQHINGFTDITTDNYVALVSYYRVTGFSLPPEATVTAGISLMAGETEKNISIPAGYTAVNATVSGYMATGAPSKEVKGYIGTQPFSVSGDTPVTTVTLNGETGQLPIAVIGKNTPVQPPEQPGDFIISAIVTCQVSARKLNEWKLSLYKEITTAYDVMVRDYDDRLSRFTRENDATNPLLISGIEKSALQNSCATLLFNLVEEKNGPLPGLDWNRQQYFRFFEEAFEWHEMTWRLNDQPPAGSYALQGKNDSLRPFLQASEAFVWIPVRPAFNYAVLYYLTAGIVWPERYPFVPVNENDTAIAVHLKKIIHWDEEGKVEKSWDVTLPTAMQVVQEGTELPVFARQKK